MKTERRHDLQTNELADWLGTKIQSVQPYSKIAMGAVIGGVALIFAVMFLSGQRSRQQASSWQVLYAATLQRDATKLEEVAKSNQGTMAGTWALQSAGDVLRAEGVSLLHIDRAQASRQLGRARTNYQQAIKQSDNDNMLKPRALIGLAQCYEALGNAKEARQQYDRVIQDWPGSAMEKVARARRDFLEQSSTREFLAWFDDQEPLVPDMGTSSLFDGTPGGAMFGAGANGSGVPDSSLPFGTLQPPDDASGAANLDQPGEGGVSVSDLIVMPENEAPSADDSPPASSAPASEESNDTGTGSPTGASEDDAQSSGEGAEDRSNEDGESQSD